MEQAAASTDTSIDELLEVKPLLVDEATFRGIGLPPQLVRQAVVVVAGLYTQHREVVTQLLTENVDTILPILEHGKLLSSREIERIVYELGLGPDGFLDGAYKDYGRDMIITLLGVGVSQSSCNEEDTGTIIGCLSLALDTLPPSRRTKIFANILDVLKDSWDKSPEELIVGLISSLGVIGNKLLQMELIIPAHLQHLAAGSKEDVRPIDKFMVLDLLEEAGLLKDVESIGPVIGSASTACVYPIMMKGRTGYASVVKVLRPDVAEQVSTDLLAISRIAGFLAERKGIKLNVDTWLEEVGEMMRQETDTFFERANAKMIDFLRRRDGNKFQISTPKIVFANRNLIQMSMACGASLNKLKNDPESASRLDLRDISRRVIGDFFWQVFNNGLFHADIHEGNVFVDDDGTITEIDYGQVGSEPDPLKRRALLELTLGLAMRSSKLCAAGLGEFMPGVSKDAVDSRLAGANDVAAESAKLLTEEYVQGSITTYVKAMSNILPYFDYLKPIDLVTLAYPYIRSYGLERDLMHSILLYLGKKYKRRLVKDTA